ncbi:MAG: ATPase, T2SS/T4P/T4SS family, partial [Gammaproteobacteria bacterium]
MSATPDTLAAVTANFVAVSETRATERVNAGLSALIDQGFLTRAQVDVARRKQQAILEMGGRAALLDILVRDRFLPRELAESIRLSDSEDTATATRNAAPIAAMQLLPLKTCEKLLVAPVTVERDILVIKAARPLNDAQKQTIIESCAMRVRGLRIVPVDVSEARQSLRRVAAEGAVLEPVLARLRMDDMSGSQLKSAISAMLTEALRLRASDIHLDARPDPDSWISYRIDSDLQQKHQLPERLMRALFMRIKTDAGMDASDSRRSQDGRLSFEFQGRGIDVRVASQPLALGETIAMRILDPDGMPGMEALFPADPAMIKLLRGHSEVFGKAGGLVLLSGPTGSGKTTTLYTMA